MRQKYSTSQLKKMKSQTDWQRLGKMTEADIDYSDMGDVTQMLVRGELHPADGKCKKN